MIVKELIEILEKCRPGAELHIGYDGNHGKSSLQAVWKETIQTPTFEIEEIIISTEDRNHPSEWEKIS